MFSFDDTLDKYLSFDVAVTAASAPRVRQIVEGSNQQGIYQLDTSLSRVGRSMASIGVTIDWDKQLAFAREYQVKATDRRADFFEAIGKRHWENGDEINPGSPLQLRRILYQDFGLPVLKLTKSDDPSTDKTTLLSLLSHGVEPRAEKAIHSLLGFRAAEKLLGTYLGRPIEVETDDDEEVFRIEKGPQTHVDGRIRTTWKIYGTVNGRWSSGDPMNLQNVPKRLREMFVAAPGHVFVAADYSALELRILAWLAHDDALIEAFRLFDEGKGPDIHRVNTCAVFGCTPDQVTDEARTFAKRFVYGLAYGAHPPKIFETMSLLRNDEFKPVFPGLTLPKIEHAFKKWWTAHPAIIDWQKRLIRGWRRDGYLESPLHHRRRYFMAGENHEEMKNFPIQSMAADMQNNAVLTIVGLVPFNYEERSGLVLQVHDALCLEVPEDDAPKATELLKHSMEARFGRMLFPAEPKIGHNWYEVS